MNAASVCCSASIAASSVANHFTELLSKYIAAGSSGDSSYSHANGGPEYRKKANRGCEQCRNYYPVLGVQADAPVETIKQAYKNLVNVWHPDRFGHNEELRQRAEARFKDIQQAYSHVTFACPSSPDDHITHIVRGLPFRNAELIHKALRSGDSITKWQHFSF